MSQEFVEQYHSYLSGLGVVFGNTIDEELLVRAFTHKSYAADFHDSPPDNERLEFLGDAVLGQRISELLFADFPQVAESQLTLSKIYLVKETTLAQVAREMQLGEQILLGRGEISQGGRDKDSVLSDALEAVIAYIYLDCGEEESNKFIDTYIYSILDDLDKVPGKSAKSRLQEWAQKKYKTVPEYTEEVATTDTAGNVESYRSSVVLPDGTTASGEGTSKKKAQEEAALNALQKLDIA